MKNQKIGTIVRYKRVVVPANCGHELQVFRAAKITSGFGHLDILVNNAGINDPADGPVPTARLDAVEGVLRTNFLGALPVTQAKPPLLRKSQAARIVNVSSGLGSLTQNGDPSYARRR
jgi:NAD(P)-dependent dehydrogenase (short-subunit alcohol dehydrogenase family)